MAKKSSKKRSPSSGKSGAGGASRASSGRRQKASAEGVWRLRSFHVDAFTSRVFHGNPAAVVMLDVGKWLPDATLQAIAQEHHLPITAFVLPKGRKPGLRWFSATREIELCGHGTLAAAHTLWNHEKAVGSSLIFSTLAGNIEVTRRADLITLDFPAIPLRKARVTNELCAALGHEPSEVYQGKWILAVFENKRDVHELAPDMPGLAALDAAGIIATAPGVGHDFVSRFFAPKHGLNEDSVTGSAHCALVPYWADRLGKLHLAAHQVSHRAGELWCELKGKRVLISGHAVTYASARITI